MKKMTPPPPSIHHHSPLPPHSLQFLLKFSLRFHHLSPQPSSKSHLPMAATVDSATQTSDFGSDIEPDPAKEGPRVEIDTSAPFGSVEEAVIRFGGRGFWIPRPVLSVNADPHHESKELSMNNLEDRASEMLKDLRLKEQETLDILKELELTKRLVEELNQKLQKDAPECKEFVKKEVIDPANNRVNKLDECANLFPSHTAGLIMMELNQAKRNLCQNTYNLAAIRASVECLNKKMEEEKNPGGRCQDQRSSNPSNESRVRLQIKDDTDLLIGSFNPTVVSRELRQLNYEAEQFMETAEAARSEVLKAMSEIERRKTGLKMIEMRWVAAKKLEEAARAAESLALAEIKALSSNEVPLLEDKAKPTRISLSLDEYSSLAEKARKGEDLFKRREIDRFEKVRETTEEKRKPMVMSNPSQKSIRDSALTHHRRDLRLLDPNELNFSTHEPKPVLRPTTSIGDILSRKLVLQDDFEIGRRTEGGRQRVSLNQMLHKHRGEASPVKRNEKGQGHSHGDSKQFFSKRKALGFVHISLPIPKQSKSKIPALNLW